MDKVREAKGGVSAEQFHEALQEFERDENSQVASNI
jgi:hypothetical protein